MSPKHTPRQQIPRDLKKHMPEIAAMMAGESPMPAGEMKELIQKYGPVLFNALLQQGTARPVVCPECKKKFEVLIRDTNALKFLVEMGFGKPKQRSEVKVSGVKTEDMSDEQLDALIRELQGAEGKAGVSSEGEDPSGVQ